MDKIEKGVREVLSQNSRYTFDEVQLSDRLDKYIPSSVADFLDRELQRKFSVVRNHSLVNDLFVSIKKVSDLVTKIKSLNQTL